MALCSSINSGDLEQKQDRGEKTKIMAMNITNISGIKMDDFRFTTIVELGWLLDRVIDGLTLESVMEEHEQRKEGVVDPSLKVDDRTLELAKIRSKMQRPFRTKSVASKMIRGERIYSPQMKPTAKYKNAHGPLKQYMLEKFAPSPDGGFGVLPGFVIYWPEQLQAEALVTPDSEMYENAGWTSYRYGDSRAVCVDGESRIAAASFIRNDPKVSFALKDQLLRQPVTVTVFHGLDKERAAQAFVDLNFEGVKVDTITKANIDPRNKWVKVTRDIFEELEIKLATSGRQITTAHIQMDEYLLLTHAVQMVKSIIKKANVFSAATDKPSAWTDVDFKKLHAAGVTWFREVFDFFGGAEVLVDRTKVVRSIAVRVAIASLGRYHYAGSQEGRKRASQILREVDWTVAPAWNGLGGKVTQKDTDGPYTMAAGSGKTSCTLVINALDGNSSRGKALRKPEA